MDKVYDKKNLRYGIIDLWKVIATFFIMVVHLYKLGFEKGSYPFYDSLRFVEFFFLISGYFTCRHYYNISANTLDDKIENSIKYTIKKFKPYMPHVICAMVTYEILENSLLKWSGIYNFIKSFFNLPFDMMLLTVSYGKYPNLVPMWYISAMFILFPCLGCLLQMKNKKFLNYLVWCIPILFLMPSLYFDVEYVYFWPKLLSRALCSLLLGCGVYFASQGLGKYKFRNWVKIIITIIEELLLVFVLTLMYRNAYEAKIYILCFVVSLIIMFSGQSYTVYIKSRTISMLSKISMPIFVWHYVVAMFVNYYLNFSLEQKVVIYFLGSILMGTISYFIVEMLKKIKLNKNIFLEQ